VLWSSRRSCNHVLPATHATRASAVLAVVILSVTRVLCNKTKQCTADILIPHERAITLVVWHQQWLVGDDPFVWNSHSKWSATLRKRRLPQISAYNVSTVKLKDSEKVQLWQIRSRPRAFQWAIDGARTLPRSSLKVAQSHFK